MKKVLIGIGIAILVLIIAGAALFYLAPGCAMGAMTSLARMSAGLSRHEVQLDRYRWVYLEGGKGETVLLVHGYGMSKDWWGAFISDLAKTNRVIAVDVPGFGENSRVPADNYRIPAQAARLHAFVEKMGLKRFHLVGFSMGGGIAGYYAGDHPDRVKSLALVAAFGLRPDKPNQAMQDYVKDSNKGFFYKTEEDFDRVMGIGFDRVPSVPAPFKKYMVQLGARNYDFDKKTFAEMAEGVGILENRLAKIQAPVFILWGKNDKAIPVANADKFRKGLRNSRVLILDAGHSVYLEQPEKSSLAYGDFIRSVKP